jgi:hypothetical protein
VGVVVGVVVFVTFNGVVVFVTFNGVVAFVTFNGVVVIALVTLRIALEFSKGPTVELLINRVILGMAE